MAKDFLHTSTRNTFVIVSLSITLSLRPKQKKTLPQTVIAHRIVYMGSTAALPAHLERVDMFPTLSAPSLRGEASAFSLYEVMTPVSLIMFAMLDAAAACAAMVDGLASLDGSGIAVKA